MNNGEVVNYNVDHGYARKLGIDPEVLIMECNNGFNQGLEAAAVHLEEHARGFAHAGDSESLKVAYHLNKKARQIREMKRNTV